MQSEKYIGALDQGTTGTRFIVFDRASRPVAQAYLEHRQLYPHPGWVEHDPAEIWQNARRVIDQALRQADLRSEELVAIGISDQRETTVVWERKTGRPLYHAIVWQDRRTTARCAELRALGYQELVQERTGLSLDPYFSATKLEWLLQNVAGLREQAERGQACFGTIDSWLIWQLTGQHITDYTNASRTMLFDIHRLAWDEDLLDLFGIPPQMLPEVRPSSEPDFYGRAHTFGHVPVCGDLGDQQAALFGQLAWEAGEAKNTYGTGLFLLLNTGRRVVKSQHGLLTTIAGAPPGEQVSYALEGSVFAGGALVQWLRDGLGIIEQAAQTEELALSVADTGGVYFVPALAGLGAPYWDPYARGLIIGLTGGSGRAELVRAALEAMAYRTRDVVQAMEADADLVFGELKVDGGAAANNFLCQFQSDILGIPVLRAAGLEATALGAAYAAGLAVGYWTDKRELQASRKIERVFTPQMTVERRAALYRGWLRAIERSRGWAKEEQAR